MNAPKKTAPARSEGGNPNDELDSGTHSAPAQAPRDSGEFDDTRFAALAARYALAGHALVRAHQPGPAQAPFYTTRWGWLRPLASLDDAEQWLRKIGGAACASFVNTCPTLRTTTPAKG